MYVTKINEGLQAPEEDIEKTWREIKQAVITAVKKVVDYKQPTRNSEWFGDECLAALSLRNEMRRKMLQKKTRGSFTVRHEKKRRRYVGGRKGRGRKRSWRASRSAPGGVTYEEYMLELGAKG